MAGKVDLSRLRDQTLGSNVDEEAVTVNTRALIDKVLARYSGDWTTLRELIQNAADASSTKIVIKFETLPSRTVPLPPNSDKASLLKHTLHHHTVYRLLVSNDGQPFAECDWSRLKRIAEGNPDETKIGAFGVGFYSVFADCEEPFVISGRKTMAFLWKGNSLYTKASSLSSEQPSQDTSFLLNYRNATSPLPNMVSICQFLCTSLTFVGIEKIELWIDEWRILNLRKKIEAGRPARIPSDLNLTTQEGMMKITEVNHEIAQIDAEWMNVVGSLKREAAQDLKQNEEDGPIPIMKSLFSRIAAHATVNTAARRAAREAEAQAQRLIDENLCETSTASVFLRISTADIKTNVARNWAAELERATKKPPPKRTRIAIMTSSHDESEASLSAVSGVASKSAEELFASVLPTRNGKIFIGFPTAQTTGMLCHVSAPSVIPTVERENIDLNARYVRTWNEEMLRAAGIVCRISYAGAMDDLKSKLVASLKILGRPEPKDEDINKLVPSAAHILKQYSAKESTPSAGVGKRIENAFWECSSSGSIEVLSSKGVLPSSKVRLVSNPLPFLKTIPVVPSELAKASEGFIRHVYERGLIIDMSIEDVRRELEARPLPEAEFREFLRWLAYQTSQDQLDMPLIKGLLNAAIGLVGETGEGSGKMIALSQINTFLNGTKIAPTLLIPDSTMPYGLTKDLSPKAMMAFGWEELHILPWLRFMISRSGRASPSEDQDFTRSPELATQVLSAVSKAWPSLSTVSRNTVLELLSDKTVMPTKLGLRKPSEAYFPAVKLFDDLPVISQLHGVKEPLLVALGVRKTIELSVVFDRLMSSSSATGDGKSRWSFADLIKYLVSVRNDIPKDDITRLKKTALCPEEDPKTHREVQGGLRYISQLYKPTDKYRQLGLPVLYWHGDFNPSSPEANFLTFLGLKDYPPAMEVINVMVSAAQKNDMRLHDAALGYYIDHYETNSYTLLEKSTISKLPLMLVEGREFPKLLNPSMCYADPGAAVLGYPVLKERLRRHASKFGVQEHPSMDDCVACVIGNPPASHFDATKTFEYFAGRVIDLKNNHAQTLGSAFIVPIRDRTTGTIRLASPRVCFLGNSTTYGDIVDFVDFGERANTFLLRIGSKSEPTSFELARMVAESPSRVLNTLGEQRYMDLLRNLALNERNLKNDRTLWKDLKHSSFLLAYREKRSNVQHEKPNKTRSEAPDEDDEDIVREFSLRKPSEIIIIDAIRDYLMFRDVIYAAPQDDSLERFYQSLAVPTLTSLVALDHRVGYARKDQTEAQHLRRLIIERARLFLHEQTQDVQHDSKWLDKNLDVSLVDGISISFTLKGYNVPPYREKRSATLEKPRSSGRSTLYITADPDLYEVSSWIVRLLLKRPKQHDTLALEMILGSDLRRLRTKGYNVDRILRQRAYETRLAEEERRQQLAAEARIAEERRQSQQNQGTAGLPPPPAYEQTSNAGAVPQPPQPPQVREPSEELPAMPGGWDESPNQKPHKGLKNLFDPFTKHFRRPGSSGGEGHVESSSSGGQIAGPRHGQEPPLHNPQAATQNINKTLHTALNQTKAHRGSRVANEEQTTILEQAKGSYCDVIPAQNLDLTGTAGGLQLFLHRRYSESERRTFLASQSQGLEMFAKLLVTLGGVFGIPAPHMHVCVDGESSCIAFNAGGALFFNYSYFEKLHAPQYATSREARIEAIAYWWMTLCHELAHNVVAEHSAAHGFYTESFAHKYFGKAMELALQS